MPMNSRVVAGDIRRARAHHTAHAGGGRPMGFFGFRKKKWDEQARKAESAAAQEEQTGDALAQGSKLSDKIIEQQQWEDSLRRFVQSEGNRHKDEDRNEEYRAVEDLKRALLNSKDQAETVSPTVSTKESGGEEEHLSLLEIMNNYPLEPVQAPFIAPNVMSHTGAQSSDESEEINNELAPAYSETPAFLRDDEKTEELAVAVPATPSDSAGEVHAHFKEHLREVRAEGIDHSASEEAEVPSAADGNDTARGSVAGEYLSADQIKEARTRAAMIEAKNVGLDDLAAAYAARLGISLDSEEGGFREIEDEAPATPETSETTEPEEATEESGVAKPAASEAEIAESADAPSATPAPASEEPAESLKVESLESEVTSADASEPAVLEAEIAESADAPSAAPVPASEAQKLSTDDAEFIAESIVLTAPAHEAADLPALEEHRALYSLFEVMRSRGSGAMSLELRQVDEDMHYRMLHRGREIENGIVLPGMDWFMPVATLYTEAQRAGTPWNRAVVSLSPRLGGGLEVQASYLGTVDGQTTSESFMMSAAPDSDQDEGELVATAEAVEALQPALEDTAAEPSETDSESESDFGTGSAAPAAVAGVAIAGAVAVSDTVAAVEDTGATEVEPAESTAEPVEVIEGPEVVGEPTSESAEDRAPAEYEHDYENDPVFGSAAPEADSAEAEPALTEGSADKPSAELATEPTDSMSTVEASPVAEPSPEHAQEMEAALTAIVANARKKLDKTQEPALPTFLDDRELLSDEEETEERITEEPVVEEPTVEVSATEAEALVTEELVAEELASEASADDESAAEVSATEAQTQRVATSAPDVPEGNGHTAVLANIPAPAVSDLNDLPTVAAEPDTPSVQVLSPLVPSETQLAEGNLVLTEAQVAQRMAPVVEHLFGENGTAKDATTVLIRVRTLGSYYDALTHVRRNGFWEQVRTFELVPETLLDIPALKTDSYSEGEGSPLAMSLTFTPGVPVQAAFSYSTEQAFVSYPRPLDAERYVEELRMFPRLGSKIPAHRTSALAHWNL